MLRTIGLPVAASLPISVPEGSLPPTTPSKMRCLLSATKSSITMFPGRVAFLGRYLASFRIATFGTLDSSIIIPRSVLIIP